MLDVTESRVCQIRGQAIARLRGQLRDCSDARARPRAQACVATGVAALGLATAVPPVRADEGGPGHAWQSVVQGPMLSVRGMRMLSPALRPARCRRWRPAR